LAKEAPTEGRAMTDDAKWITLSDKVTPADLREHGITLAVTIAPVLNPARRTEVLAEIDTGANQSAISRELARAFGVNPSGYGRQHHAQARGATLAAFFRCLVTFPGGGFVEIHATVLPRSIKPHDVLIGRDVLTSCRLSVDYVLGEWSLALRSSRSNHDDG
jgi:predicted aspartyl protease